MAIAYLLGGTALLIGLILVVMLRRQGAMLNDVSQRLTKLSLLFGLLLAGATTLTAQEQVVTGSTNYKCTSAGIVGGTTTRLATAYHGNACCYIGQNTGSSGHLSKIVVGEATGGVSLDGSTKYAQSENGTNSATGLMYTEPGYGTSLNTWIGSDANGDDHLNWSGGVPGNASTAAGGSDPLRQRRLKFRATANPPVVRNFGSQSIESVTVEAGGKLVIGKGAVMKLVDEGLVTVKSGGLLELRGANVDGTPDGSNALSNAANIVPATASEKWTLDVQSGATLKASGFNISAGKILVSANNATIDLNTGRFSEVRAFTPSTRANNTFIDFQNARSGTFGLYRLHFERVKPGASALLAWSEISNISASIGGPEVIVNRFKGELAGETFDSDAGNRVKWVNNDGAIQLLSGGLGKLALKIGTSVAFGGASDVRYGNDGYWVRWDGTTEKMPAGEPAAFISGTSIVAGSRIASAGTLTTAAQRDPAVTANRSNARLQDGTAASVQFTLGAATPRVLDISVYVLNSDAADRQTLAMNVNGASTATFDATESGDTSTGKLFRFRAVGLADTDTLTFTATKTANTNAVISAVYFDAPRLNSLDEALAGLPPAGSTLRISASYSQNGLLVKSGGVRKGRLNIPSFAGTVEIDGFALSNGPMAGPVVSAGSSGTLRFTNCMFLDESSNTGVPYKTAAFWAFNRPPNLGLTLQPIVRDYGPLGNHLAGTGTDVTFPASISEVGAKFAGGSASVLRTPITSTPAGFTGGDAASGWTFECFIRQNAGNPGDKHPIFTIWADNDAAANSALAIYQNAQTVVVRMVDGGGTAATALASDNFLSDNTTWHHLAVTWKANELKIYVDGAQSGGTGTVASYNNPATPPKVEIGRETSASIAAVSMHTTTGFVGELDDVCFTARWMSQSEVVERATRRQLVKTGGAVIELRFCTIDGEVQNSTSIRESSTAANLQTTNIIVGTPNATPFSNNNGNVQSTLFDGPNAAKRENLWQHFANYHIRDLRLTHAARLPGVDGAVPAAANNGVAVPTLDIDGETRDATHANNQRGADFYQAGTGAGMTMSNTLMVEAISDITGGLALVPGAVIVETAPNVNVAAQSIYVASSDGTKGYISVLNSKTLTVLASIEFDAYRVGSLSWMASSVAGKYWLFASYDSDADGRYDSVYRVLDEVSGTPPTTHNLTNAARVNDSVGGLKDVDGAAIFSAGTLGWDGLLSLESAFVTGISGDQLIPITKRTGTDDGEVHVFFIKKTGDATGGDWYNTNTFTAKQAAQSFNSTGGGNYQQVQGFTGGGKFNPNPFSQPHMRSDGTFELSRFADADAKAVYTVDRSLAAPNPVAITNGIDFGYTAGEGFAYDPFWMIGNAGRRIVTSSQRPLVHQFIEKNGSSVKALDLAAAYRHSGVGAGYSTSELDLASFKGVPGMPPLGASNHGIIFVPLFNESFDSGRGAIAALPWSIGAAASIPLLDTQYTNANQRMHPTAPANGDFKEGVAPVIGRPTSLRMHLLDLTVACSTDAGLIYMWRYNTTAAPPSDKAKLLRGYPIQISGGRVTALFALLLAKEDATGTALLSKMGLNPAVNPPVASGVPYVAFTDSGQILILQSPRKP